MMKWSFVLSIVTTFSLLHSSEGFASRDTGSYPLHQRPQQQQIEQQQHRSRYAFDPVLPLPAPTSVGSGFSLINNIGRGAARSTFLPWKPANQKKQDEQPRSGLSPIVPSTSSANNLVYNYGGAAAATLPWPQSQGRRAPLNNIPRDVREVVLENMSNLFGVYMKFLKEKPQTTKSVSAAIVQTLGDLLSQRLMAFINGQPVVYDFARTFSFALTGFFFNAPYLHRWFGMIAQYGNKLQRKFGLSENQRVGAELALDQGVGVFIYFPMYFYAYELCASMAYWRAPQLGAIAANGIGPILGAIKASYFFWPFMQLICLKAVPEQLRVMFNNLVSVVWNVFFCAMVAG